MPLPDSAGTRFANLYYGCLPGCLPQLRFPDGPAQVLGRGIASHYFAILRTAQKHQICQSLTPGTKLPSGLARRLRGQKKT